MFGLIHEHLVKAADAPHRGLAFSIGEPNSVLVVEAAEVTWRSCPRRSIGECYGSGSARTAGVGDPKQCGVGGWAVASAVPMSSEKKNHFPPTLCTWIEGRLDDGTIGRDAINRHVMESYELPLRIYYLGTSWRTLGEPEDIINGFMADRLERPNFFTQWKSSGKRLRHWLINALHFYLKEQWRRDRRHDAMSIDRGTSEDTDHSAFEPSFSDRDVDRAVG